MEKDQQLNEIEGAQAEEQGVEQPYEPAPLEVSQEYINMAFGHQLPVQIGMDYVERHLAPFLWAWYEKPYNTALFIGGKDKGRDDVIARFAELKTEYDPMSVYRVKVSDEKPEGEEKAFGFLYDYEQIPDFMNMDDAQTLNEARTFFVSSYFTLLAKEKGVPRDEIVNRPTYKPDKEGPLLGYIRAVEQSPHFDWLRDKLRYFGQSIWHQTPQGLIRHIPSNAPIEEKAVMLFEYLWELHYLYLGMADIGQPHQCVYTIDIPSELLEDEQTKNLILKALSYLLWDAEVAELTVIVTIDEPNEICELPISQHILFNSKQAFAYRALGEVALEREEISLLEDEEDGTALWVNRVDGEKYPLRLYSSVPHSLIDLDALQQ